MSDKADQAIKKKKKTNSAPSSSSSSSNNNKQAAAANFTTTSTSAAAPVLDERTKKILRIRELLRQRDQARNEGQFGKSDVIREQLLSQFEIDIIDQKNGPSGFRFKDGTSNKLPPGVHLPESVAGKKRSRDDETPANTSSEQGDKKKVKINAPPTTAAAKPKPAKPSAEQERNKALISNLVAPTGTERKVQGVIIEDLKIGTGQTSKIGDRIKMHYVGKLKSNGKVFDSSVKKPFVFRLGRGEVIPGWEIGCQGMAIGGKRKLTIPPEKAYGRAGAPPTIPSNATLVFEVQLVDIA